MYTFPKVLSGLALILVALIPLACIMECEYVGQNEIGFKYNVNSGKPVSEENNPLLPFGWTATFGWNSRFFIINSEVNSYSFTADIRDPRSPFDESLNWDSIEGVTMQVDFTPLGRVTNPWKFYANWGQLQRSYTGIEEIQDERIYEAIRQAAEFVSVKMNELGSQKAADEIRRTPGDFTRTLTTEAARYMEKFGFTVTDVIFPERMIFPGEGGKAIDQARSLLETANSDLEKKKKEVATVEGEKDAKIADANIKARTIIGDATRKANALQIKAEALAAQMKASIDQVGVDGAMRLKMAEQQQELVKEGIIREVFLTGDSLFGAPFYSTNKQSK